MSSHLEQPVANHITLELVGGINGGYGPGNLGWVRILPDGNIQAGPGGGNYVVPARHSLVITDADWQFDDHGTTHAGALVTLRLFIVGPGQLPPPRRLMESTIVLSNAGQGGTVAAWTAGGVFGPGTKIGIDTSPLNPASKLQHAMLHGYLTRSGKAVPAAKAKRGR
jgi:hypothetical protein